MDLSRMNMGDVFDNNTYNHDPHTQFMNWSSTMLTWDYPADTIGYTTGIAFELNQPDWALRYGWFQLPSIPNGFTSDDRIFMYPVEHGEKTGDVRLVRSKGLQHRARNGTQRRLVQHKIHTLNRLTTCH